MQRKVYRKEYIVEAIVGKRVDNRSQELYLVKWQGYPSSKNTWEPVSHLYNVMYMVEEYNLSQREPNEQLLKQLLYQEIMLLNEKHFKYQGSQNSSDFEINGINSQGTQQVSVHKAGNKIY